MRVVDRRDVWPAESLKPLSNRAVVRSRRRRCASPRAARSGTPYGRAAWVPVPSAVPIGRLAERQPTSITAKAVMGPPP
jgi:hypothetical protein